MLFANRLPEIIPADGYIKIRQLNMRCWLANE